MGSIVERHYPGDRITLKASATITGGQVVAFTAGGQVGPAGADSAKVAGVALQDAASGALVTVASVGIYPLTASGSISAGDRVVAAASGAVKTVAPIDTSGATGAAPVVIGVAQADASNGATVFIKLACL